MRAALYTRISRDIDGTGAGVERQEGDCRALVDREGWTLTRTYTDNSVSAFSGKGRPAFADMLADAKDGAFDVLVAWHDDRLWRNVTEQQAVTAMLAEVGVELIATPTRTYRTDSVDDGFLVGLQALLAQRESAHSGRRKKRQKQQLAEQGRDGGGHRAFGYKADRVTVDPEEAAHLRQGFDHLMAGGSMIGLCRKWVAAGVTTSKGRPWTPSVLKRLMLNPRLAGLRVHHGEVVGEAEWDAVFTVDQHRRLTAELTKKERTRSGPTRSYLLTGGIAVCGRCGADLHAQRRPNGQASYKCYQAGGNFNGCGRIAVVAEALEDFTRDVVFAALDGDGLAQAVATALGEDDRRADVVGQLRDAEDRLQSLEVAHYVDGELSRAGYLAARRKLTDRGDSLRRSLDDDSRLGVLATLPATQEALRAKWDESPVCWRRSLVSALIETVTLNPANGKRLFSGDRVDVRWRV